VSSNYYFAFRIESLTIKSATIAVAVLSCSLTTNAAVYRVNNNPGVDADFTSLSAAIAGASAGDTLYFESSPTSYGDGTVSKQLILMGAGYFLIANDTTQAYKYTAKLGNVTIAASGVHIQGIEFVGSSAVSVQANNVTISRCIKTTGTSGAVLVNNSITGATITQCFFSASGNIIQVNTGATATISNNYLRSGNTNAISSVSTTTTISVLHNVLQGNLVLYNATITNNILISGTYSGTGNTETYNMCNATQFSGTGSIQNAVMNNIFDANGGSYDKDYRLACAGGATDGCGDGLGGVDMGMFDNVTPSNSYVLSGIPAIPAIFSFDGTGTASPGVPLQLHIKVNTRN
jgi:hypothetical protein